MSKEKDWAVCKVGVRRSTHKRLKKHLKNYGDTMDSVIVKLLDAYEKSILDDEKEDEKNV